MRRRRAEGRQTQEEDSRTLSTSQAIMFNDNNVSVLRPSSGYLVWGLSTETLIAGEVDGVREYFS